MSINNNQEIFMELQNNKIIKKIIKNLKNIFNDNLIIHHNMQNDKLIIHFNINNNKNFLIIKNINLSKNKYNKKIQNEIDKIKYEYEYKILLNNLIHEYENKKILNQVKILNNNLLSINNKVNSLLTF
jgi:hypothetical protein